MLDLHQDRVDRTFRRFFPTKSTISLSKHLKEIPQTGKYKCRIEYGENDYQLEYQSYQDPMIGSLQLVDGGSIDYDYKSADRGQLTQLFELRKDADDVIILKNDKITDSYFANLAFHDGAKWFTPKEPLLKGIKREKLLANGSLIELDIRVNDLSGFQKVSLINAMLDLDQVCVAINKVKK